MSASTPSMNAPVAIVGAGPVGLALALGLARLGVRSVVVECKPRTSERSKAPAIQHRTREVFRQWGVEERFVAAGTLRTDLAFHSADSARSLASLDFTELSHEADRPGLLVLEQGETERLLLESVRETGLCEVRFGAEAVRLQQELEGAELVYRQDGAEHRLQAAFVAGCDGAGSFVRDALGLPFDGFTYSIRPMLADVRIDDARDRLEWPRVHNGRGGVTAGIRLSEGLWRIIRLERGGPDGDDEVPEREVGKRVAGGRETGGGSAWRWTVHIRMGEPFPDPSALGAPVPRRPRGACR